MKYDRDYAKFKRKKFLSHSVVDLLNTFLSVSEELLKWIQGKNSRLFD